MFHLRAVTGSPLRRRGRQDIAWFGDRTVVGDEEPGNRPVRTAGQDVAKHACPAKRKQRDPENYPWRRPFPPWGSFCPGASHACADQPIQPAAQSGRPINRDRLGAGCGGKFWQPCGHRGCGLPFAARVRRSGGCRRRGWPGVSLRPCRRPFVHVGTGAARALLKCRIARRSGLAARRWLPVDCMHPCKTGGRRKAVVLCHLASGCFCAMLQ